MFSLNDSNQLYFAQQKSPVKTRPPTSSNIRKSQQLSPLSLGAASTNDLGASDQKSESGYVADDLADEVS